MTGSMKGPIFIRPLRDTERQQLEIGLHSSDILVFRRHILMVSGRGQNARQIAHQLGCSDQNALSAIRAFVKHGLKSLQSRSSVRPAIHAAFDTQGAERLRTVLHQSPRPFGMPTSS